MARFVLLPGTPKTKLAPAPALLVATTDGAVLETADLLAIPVGFRARIIYASIFVVRLILRLAILIVDAEVVAVETPTSPLLELLSSFLPASS